MKLLRVFARAHQGRAGVMLGCLLLAGIAEGVGLSGLLPLLDLAAGAGDASDAVRSATPLGAALIGTLHAIGVQPTAGVLLLVIVAGTGLKAALVLLANQQVGYSVAQLATDLRLDLIRAVLRTRWEYYVHAPVGAFANAVASEASRASDAYLQATSILMLLIQVAVYATVACLISWPATVVALLAGVVVTLALQRLVRLARRAGQRQTRLAKSLVTQLTDVLQAVKPLKAMGREHLLGPLLEGETRRLNRALELEVWSGAAMRSLQDPLNVVVLAVGAYAALSLMRLPLPTVVMLVLLSTRILDCLGRVQRDYQAYAVGESAFDSLREMTRQAEAAREIGHGGSTPTLRREVRLAGVNFDYDGKSVLRDASMTIPAGQLTVITGASGSGKTTVADLVIGLIEPRAGAVLVDGVPLSGLDVAKWRGMIGYVPQETLLMHDTIAANITLGDPRLTAADVEAALRAAGAEEFVAAMPEGVDTVAGERGLRLSGGQRQRIALARALVRKPALLVLDEATAALDRDAEAGICETLRRLRGQVTVLAICHQGRLIEIADAVHRVDGGAIVRVQLRPLGDPAAARA